MNEYTIEQQARYSIGAILGNVSMLRDQEVFLNSIEYLLENLDIDYTHKDVVEGFANCFDSVKIDIAKEQLQMLKEQKVTLAEIVKINEFYKE